MNKHEKLEYRFRVGDVVVYTGLHAGYQSTVISRSHCDESYTLSNGDTLPGHKLELVRKRPYFARLRTAILAAWYAWKALG